MLDDPAHAEKYRFFVLAVQCPWELGWFDQTGDASPGTRRSDDMLTVAADILRRTMRECPVDPDRVYLLGISSGASASWEMATRWPELFAALVPLACGSSGSDESRAEKLIKIPIWAFINNGERAGVERMVSAVQAAGGNAFLTVADSPGHNAWSAPLRGGSLTVDSWPAPRGSLLDPAGSGTLAVVARFDAPGCGRRLRALGVGPRTKAALVASASRKSEPNGTELPPGQRA